MTDKSQNFTEAKKGDNQWTWVLVDTTQLFTWLDIFLHAYVNVEQ